MAYTHYRNVDAPRVHSIDIETGESRLLVADALAPSWSPTDINLLVFTRMDESGGSAILLKDLKLGTETRITRGPGVNAGAVFSPDGTQLAFYSDRDGDREIYVMATSGADVRQLTTNDAAEVVPAWSPDGRWIAYQSDRSGAWEIFLVETSTGAESQLTVSTDILH